MKAAAIVLFVVSAFPVIASHARPYLLSTFYPPSDSIPVDSLHFIKNILVSTQNN